MITIHGESLGRQRSKRSGRTPTKRPIACRIARKRGGCGMRSVRGRILEPIAATCLRVPRHQQSQDSDRGGSGKRSKHRLRGKQETEIRIGTQFPTGGSNRVNIFDRHSGVKLSQHPAREFPPIRSNHRDFEPSCAPAPTWARHKHRCVLSNTATEAASPGPWSSRSARQNRSSIPVAATPSNH